MFRVLRRKWSSPPHDRYDTFTVMTYNLLSNTLALNNKHLYRHCAQSDIVWRNRSRRLIQELRSQWLDIYCLQEIDKEHYVDLFQPAFRDWGYSGVYKKRNGSKTDGCAIFFRNSTVKAIRLLGVNYDENPFSKKENIGIVGIFDIKHRDETRRVCLATSHIIFHPTYGMAKIAQLRMLLDNARTLIEDQKADIPIVLCGDFNALPYSTVLRYLTDANVDVSAIPEWRLSGQVSHAPCTFKPPYENKITAFHNAFPDNGHGFLPSMNVSTTASVTKCTADTTTTIVDATATTSVVSTAATATTTTSTTSTMLTQHSALAWSASDLRSLIRKSKKEWIESAESSTNNVTDTTIPTTTATVANLSSTETSANPNNLANTHTIFSSDKGTNAITSTVRTSQQQYPVGGGVICQPFSLKTAYPFFAGEESARRQGSNRSPKGAPWTTFHSGGKLVCDYIFHGQLRVPVTDSPTMPVVVSQKLRVDGILELPCAELHHNCVRGLPSEECGSDHLSLVARFKFV
ncbi:Protein angel 2 [Linnemannia exigua]|uniref:Protein angel 2 n=1 Tax=Linnemannia exigua TaxID=604196 RepID=A0AAD4D7B8_9FUNG|nr:Protein angel 2 [Linnemannia exigua]